MQHVVGNMSVAPWVAHKALAEIRLHCIAWMFISHAQLRSLWMPEVPLSVPPVQLQHHFPTQQVKDTASAAARANAAVDQVQLWLAYWPLTCLTPTALIYAIAARRNGFCFTDALLQSVWYRHRLLWQKRMHNGFQLAVLKSARLTRTTRLGNNEISLMTCLTRLGSIKAPGVPCTWSRWRGHRCDSFPFKLLMQSSRSKILSGCASHVMNIPAD
jgi:hypothetical protein